MNKPIQDLTPRISDGLKVIYGMQERGQKVSTSAVSKQLGTSDATVTLLFQGGATISAPLTVDPVAIGVFSASGGGMGPAVAQNDEPSLPPSLNQLTSPALPGHYLLGILPLAALVRFQGQRQRIFVVMLLGALLLGQLETVVWPQLLLGQWIGIAVLNLRNAAILASFALLLSGKMRPFVPAAKTVGARVTNALPKSSLGWAVESGVRS